MATIDKHNCGRELDLPLARAAQIEMLDEIAKICEENNLKYFLSGGTLLGAIRHQGYIPWDDDIDINMPRPDIEKLIQLTDGKIGRYMLSGGQADPFAPACQWYRMYSPDVVVENFYGGASDQPFYHPMFLDIFPIDGFPEGKIQTDLFCKWLIFLKKMIGVSWHDRVIANTKARYIQHLLAWIPAKLIGYKRLRQAFQKAARKYPYESAKYVGVTTIVQYLPREKMPKEDYTDTIKVLFEGKWYNAPKNYDFYLTSLYHDYMTLPPVEKRKSNHAFKLYEYIKD